jgi:hypothetical protein
LTLLVAGLLTACTVPQQPPQLPLADRLGLPAGSIATIGVLPPDITLRELAAGGASQERDDWSKSAREASRDMLERIRAEKFVYLRDLDLSEEMKEEIEDVMALYRAINLTFITRLYGMSSPPTSTRPSLGSLDSIADAAGADALMLVYGVDDIFTADRQAIAALGIAAAFFTRIPILPSSGEGHLSAALVDRNGQILWYNIIGADQLGDLRKPDGVRRTLETLLRTFPPSVASPATEVRS